MKQKPAKYSKSDLYEKIINASYDCLCVTDSTGHFIVANKATLDSMNLSEEEVLGKTPYELIEGNVYNQSTILEAIQTKKAVTNIVNVRGVQRLSTSVPYFDEQGNVEFIITNNRSDIVMDEFARLLAYEKEQHTRYKNITNYLCTSSGSPMVCVSEKMKAIRWECATIAATDSPVMLIGESGVGKELVAKFIHSESTRGSQAFIPVNCSAIPPELFESEFFGYRPGAFTGANSKGKQGLLQMADKGTLFLDELGELPLLMQSKLLRFVENGEFYPVGSNKPEKVDVRIITATNRNLLQMIEDKTFRNDLYYRLYVLPIQIPALRDRPDDIAAIGRYYVDYYNQKYCKRTFLSDDNLKFLLAYSWPGNVRELRNVVERAVLICPPGKQELSLSYMFAQDKMVSEELLNKESDRNSPMQPAEEEGGCDNASFTDGQGFCLPSLDIPLQQALDQFQEQYIQAVIRKNNGKLNEAAKSLGIHRTTLYRKQMKNRDRKEE